MPGALRPTVARITSFLGALGATFFLLMSVSAADLNHQTLALNSFSPGSTGATGAALTSKILTAGRTYIVKVSGTYSAYPGSLMDGSPGRKICGTPVNPPSGSGLTDLEGQDSEFIFAKPVGIRRPCPAIPFLHPNFVISTHGVHGTFTHVDPIGGPPATMNRHHRYRYSIVGTGHRAAFKLLDTNTTDNYGVLIITVRAT